MIFKFRIISVENKDFARELLIDGANTFLDFHHALQEDLEYDPKQLASFFITNSAWEKKVQITLIDMMDEESENVTTMDLAKIEDHFEEAGGRMLYVFDFFSERSFFIELTETIDLKDKKTDPKIMYSSGEPPPQIDLGLEYSTPEDDFDDDLGSFDDELSSGFDFIDTDDLPNE